MAMWKSCVTVIRVIIIISCPFFYLQAQDTKAFFIIDQQPINAGDTFILNLHVTGVMDTPSEIDFSPWGKWLFQEDILSKSGWEKKGNQWVQRIVAIAFDSLDVVLPSLELIGPNKQIIQTSPIQLKVVPMVLKPETVLEAPREIRKELFSWSDGLIVLLVFATLGGVIWFLLHRRKKIPMEVVHEHLRPIVPSIEEETMIRLHALAEQNLWEKGEIKTFYIELSQIIKGYLERKYEIPALESTTQEIEVLLRGVQMEEGFIQQYKVALSEADLAKYAQVINSTRDYRQLLNDVGRTIFPTLNKELL